MAEPFRVSDPATLKAIAHPLRQRILYELGVLGHARAADLAKALDQPANVISFHLRTLGEAGIIVEAPELAQDKRDRVWKRVSDAYNVDPSVPGIDAAVAPYADWLRWLIAHADELNTESTTANVNLRDALLTRAEADQLIEEINDVIERWHENSLASARTSRDEPGRHYYRYLFAIGPTEQPNEEGGSDEEGVQDEAPE